jgi:hypothetical protein
MHQLRYGALRQVYPACFEAPVDHPHAALLGKSQPSDRSDHIQAEPSIGESQATLLFRSDR